MEDTLFIGYLVPEQVHDCMDLTNRECVLCAEPVEEDDAKSVALSLGNSLVAGCFLICPPCDDDIRSYFRREWSDEMTISPVGDDLREFSRWLKHFGDPRIFHTVVPEAPRVPEGTIAYAG